MPKIQREELSHLIEMSSLQMNEEEATAFLQDLEKLLNYTDELMTLTIGSEHSEARNVNVLRNDEPHTQTTTDFLLQQAPEREEQYFVVPRIVDETKDTL